MSKLTLVLVCALIFAQCTYRLDPAQYEYRPARLVDSIPALEWNYVDKIQDSVIIQTWEFLDNHFQIQYSVPIWVHESRTQRGTIKAQNRAR